MRSMLSRIGQLGPGGGKRTVPVREFLEARERGDLATEQAFFEGLLLPNGVYKTTRAHRLDDLLPVLVNVARGARALDIGCSSGVTTAELHAGIEAAATVGTDMVIEARLYEWNDGTLLVDSAGRPLQVQAGERASPWRFGPRDRFYRPGFVKRARAIMRRPRLEPATPVRLLSGRASAPGLSFVEEDVLAPVVPGQFQLVRVANLLNRDNFPRGSLARMVRAILPRVEPGGILFVVRTQGSPPRHDGTLFRVDGGVSVEQRVGRGSEIEDLVLAQATERAES